MKTLTITLFTLFSLSAVAQVNPPELDVILEEGTLLYHSEMASWYGTDIMLENIEDKSTIGGYFSYVLEDSARCVFFSKAEKPEVMGTITFDSTYDTKTAHVDMAARTFTEKENNLYLIRNAAIESISGDTLFKMYNKTNFNIIPLIAGNERKVYILTGPTEHGVVIFGNDYLLTFDEENKLISKKQLHKNIIPIGYSPEAEKGSTTEGTMHTHLAETGDLPTATDICTLMLYQKFTTWKTHTIVSEKYMTTWDCKKGGATAIPMDVVRKINKDQEKRSTKKKKKNKK